ncbi:hypothetical protein HID58_060886 [Brassica napus]|nr:hypothetical protein HID58_060886 [Brassica napus]CAF1850949.1 unnamed protein product [Brassica napus]CDY66347.1 BnaUnng01420D [Brassica napus]
MKIISGSYFFDISPRPARDVSPFLVLPFFFPFAVPAFVDVSFLRIGDGFEREVVRLGGTAATGPLDFSCLVFFPGGRPGLRLAAGSIGSYYLRGWPYPFTGGSTFVGTRFRVLSIQISSRRVGTLGILQESMFCLASSLFQYLLREESLDNSFCSGEPEGASGGSFPGMTEEDVPDSFAIDRHFYRGRRKMSVPGIPSSTFRGSFRNYRESSVSFLGQWRGCSETSLRDRETPLKLLSSVGTSSAVVGGPVDRSRRRIPRGEKKSAPIRDKGPRDNRREYPWDRCLRTYLAKSV